jgi:hypothetical protein
MAKVLNAAVVRRGQQVMRGSAVATTATLLVLLGVGVSVGDLTGKLHMSMGDALGVLGLLTGVGGAAAAAAFPIIAPLIGTLEFLLLVGGTAAVLGF